MNTPADLTKGQIAILQVLNAAGHIMLQSSEVRLISRSLDVNRKISRKSFFRLSNLSYIHQFRYYEKQHLGGGSWSEWHITPAGRHALVQWEISKK